jgi:hypothetical protein
MADKSPSRLPKLPKINRVQIDMKQATLTIPEIGLIAATRGMLAAGAALMLADRIPKERRKFIALPLLAIGVLSTLPLAIDVIRKVKKAESDLLAKA